LTFVKFVGHYIALGTEYFKKYLNNLFFILAQLY